MFHANNKMEPAIAKIGRKDETTPARRRLCYRHRTAKCVSMLGESLCAPSGYFRPEERDAPKFSMLGKFGNRCGRCLRTLSRRNTAQIKVTTILTVRSLRK